MAIIGAEQPTIKEEDMTYIKVGEGVTPTWTQTDPPAEGQLKSKASGKQVGGGHYKDKAIQPWDVIDTFDHAQAMGFYRGNAIKYIMRAGSKGPAREDYEKAIHYLEKLLEVL